MRQQRASWILEGYAEIVQDVADVGTHQPSAGAAHRADRVGAQEPVSHVNAVNMLLDDNVAGALAVEKPVADLLFFLRPIAFAPRKVAGHPSGADHVDLADVAAADPVVSLDVTRTVALLEIDNNVA